MAKALAVVMTMRSQKEKIASGPDIHITRRRGAVAGTRRTRQRRARYDNSRHPVKVAAARTSALRTAVTSPNSASLIHFGGVDVGARAKADQSAWPVSQPFLNPARRSPSTMKGQRRMSRQIRPER